MVLKFMMLAVLLLFSLSSVVAEPSDDPPFGSPLDPMEWTTLKPSHLTKLDATEGLRIPFDPKPPSKEQLEQGLANVVDSLRNIGVLARMAAILGEMDEWSTDRVGGKIRIKISSTYLAKTTSPDHFRSRRAA